MRKSPKRFELTISLSPQRMSASWAHFTNPINFGGNRFLIQEPEIRKRFALRCVALSCLRKETEREREEAMEMEDLEPRYTGLNSQKEAEIVEEAKVRCVVVENRIQSLPLSKITDSCKRTLLRLVNSELKFLNRLSASQGLFGPISVNIGYLESIVHILQQPSVTGISRVCKPIPVSSVHGKNEGSNSKGVHVDIVCNFNRRPVWFVVSDRNPKYISWSGSHRNKGLRNRIEQILEEACSSLTLKPTAIILFFSNGLDEVVSKKLQDEFGASVFVTETTLVNYDLSEELDGDWVNVVVRSYEKACMFQIKVDCTVETISVLDNGDRDSVLEDAMPKLENGTQVVVGDEFCSLISKMRSVSLDMVTAKPEDLSGRELLNFDTTALIALVSGISNGGTEKLLATPENEMRKRFKSNFEFVIAQVMSELQNPILKELSFVISGKICMICESVHLEFKELVSMCGGPNEKLRADRLLECLLIVPDNPSARMMGLLTTRKIAAKNKVVFGTGDYWRAPTLTANMGFVRAISQTGMSLLTLEHRPRALTGD